MYCNLEGGCGTVSRVERADNSMNSNSGRNSGDYMLSYSQMSEYIEPQPDVQITGNGAANTSSGQVSSTGGSGTMAAASDVNDGFGDRSAYLSPNSQIPSVNTSTSPVGLMNNPIYSGPGPLIPNAPIFKVPSNPLLPPEYQELLSYNDLQYLNGFLRTQIGKYMRVEQLVGSNIVEERYGYLVGVGNNYIILQELTTNNVMALDYYNIKMVYIYLSNPNLPTNSRR